MEHANDTCTSKHKITKTQGTQGQSSCLILFTSWIWTAQYNKDRGTVYFSQFCSIGLFLLYLHVYSCFFFLRANALLAWRGNANIQLTWRSFSCFTGSHWCFSLRGGRTRLHYCRLCWRFCFRDSWGRENTAINIIFRVYWFRQNAHFFVLKKWWKSKLFFVSNVGDMAINVKKKIQ